MNEEQIEAATQAIKLLERIETLRLQDLFPGVAIIKELEDRVFDVASYLEERLEESG